MVRSRLRADTIRNDTSAVPQGSPYGIPGFLRDAGALAASSRQGLTTYTSLQVRTTLTGTAAAL